MSKKENHKRELAPLLDEYIRTGNEEKIAGYLISNSNLPGRRANLELAWAFSEMAEAYSRENPEKIWRLCTELAEISADEAPANTQMEYLPFCGTVALGAFGSAHPGYHKRSLSHLRRIADDQRWRLREAVAMGVQRLLRNEDVYTLKGLEGWIEGGEWLAMRAAAAGVAEPAFLRTEDSARRALDLHRKILGRILDTDERGSDEFRTLRKGLAYTLSVVVSAIPNEGFEYVRQLIDLQDKDILWIIRENLKKNRLLRSFPDEVAKTRNLLRDIKK